MTSSSTIIDEWYQKAQIDYRHHYMSLYAAFNAWYRTITGKDNDREALNILRRGNPLWDEYSRGSALPSMEYTMRLLVECTQREPISHQTPHWQGEVQHIRDWASLLEFWYRVRCLVMHGVDVRSTYVYLAYETLNCFMTEAVRRRTSENCLQSGVLSV